MDDLVVKLVETEEERQAAFAIRVRVFVQEQGVPVEEELDEDDEAATHAIAMLGGNAAGTGRVLCLYSPIAADQASGQPGYSTDRDAILRAKRGEARIGRMAVERAWRRKGIGSRILRTLEEEARQRGMAEAVLHAQTYVKSFYAAQGYVEEGEVFLEAGIEHVQMRKRL